MKYSIVIRDLEVTKKIIRELSKKLYYFISNPSAFNKKWIQFAPTVAKAASSVYSILFWQGVTHCPFGFS